MKFFKLLVIVSLLFLVGCTNIPKKAWINPTKSLLILDLQPGDIILKEKEFTLLGPFGHVGIMLDDRTVVDYPKFGESIIKADIEEWLELNRKFTILRYKDMTEKFSRQLVMNLRYYIRLSRPYKISFDRYNSRGFYCSHFVWYIYFKTARDLGFHLDLTPKATKFIFPYDFLNSEKLELDYLRKKK